jgi:hypothetical protein
MILVMPHPGNALLLSLDLLHLNAPDQPDLACLARIVTLVVIAP